MGIRAEILKSKYGRTSIRSVIDDAEPTEVTIVNAEGPDEPTASARRWRRS